MSRAKRGGDVSHTGARRWTDAALVRRHLGNRPGASFTVAALMLLLAAVAVIAPLGVTAVGDAAMRERLGALSPTLRDAVASNHGFPQVAFGEIDDTERMLPWEEFAAALEDVRAAQPEELRSLLSPALAATYLDTHSVVGADGPASAYATMLLAPDLQSEVGLVEGAAPLPPPLDYFDALYNEELDGNAPIAFGEVEIMLSVASAAELEVGVGDRLEISVPDLQATMPLRITGLFEADDPKGAYWQHVSSVLEPSISFTPDNTRERTVTAVLDPGALSAMPAVLQNGSVTRAWYPLNVDAISTKNAAQVLAQLRAFSSVSQTVGEPSIARPGIQSLRFSSEAQPTIELAIAEARAIVAVVAVTISGPLGVAVAVLLLGCRMLVEQRRSALRLLEARGARPQQLRGLLALQGLFVGVVPVALGAALGTVAFLALGTGTDISWPVFVLPVVLAFAPAAILAIGGFRGLAFKGRTDMDASVSPTARRLRVLLEAATVGLTVVAVTLLLTRGIEAGEGEIVFDPLLVAAPLLLALVACIVALRLYPLPLRALLGRFRRSPGFVGFLGAARALREPAAGLAPALALIVGLSVAVSSGVLLSTLQQGVVTSAGMQVGADLKLDAARFTAEQVEQIAAADGVRAITTIREQGGAELIVDGKRRLVSAFIVDQAGLEDVQPAAFRLIPGDISLTPTGKTLPVLVSDDANRRWAAGATITAEDMAVNVAGVVDTATPLGARSNWILIDTASAALLFDTLPPVRTVLVALDPGVDAAAASTTLREIVSGTAAGAAVRISTPESVISAIGDGPASAGLRIALLLCIVFVALLSAVAVVMTLVLGTRARERLLALLPSLGANRRSGGALAAWEILPAAASAVIVGSLFGAALPLLVLAAVDLRPFTGSPVQPVYAIDPLVLGAAIGGFLLVAALLTLAALAVSRRARAASVLRTVEEA